jgi:hypothetical protein
LKPKPSPRPLLVGEASNLPSGEAFAGRSGRRLADLLGMTIAEFLVAFERVNLIPFWPGRSGGLKGHLFPTDVARLRATSLDVRGRRVVLAGLRVASAFGLKEVAFLRPVRLDEGEASCVVVPHPSGMVRFYNEKANRRAVGRILRRVLKLCGSSGSGSRARR